MIAARVLPSSLRLAVAAAVRPLVGLYLLALVPAASFALGQPVWSRVDEAQHADVLAHYRQADLPVEGRALLEPEIVALMRSTGVYRWDLPGSRPLPGISDPRLFAQPPALTPRARSLWVQRHLWGFSYEAAQPPLYYLLAEAAWTLGELHGGTLSAVYATRLLSALLIALAAPLAYLLVRSLRLDQGGSALLAGAITALLPGLFLNASQVTNDGLAAVLGGCFLLAALNSARDGWTARRGALAGALLGLGLMTKLTVLGLAPTLLLALAWPGPQGLRERAGPALAAFAGLALVVAPWALINLLIYGQPVPTRAADSLLGQVFMPAAPSLGGLGRSLANAFVTFWTGEPLDSLRAASWISAGAGVLTLFGGLGLLLWRWRAAAASRRGSGVGLLVLALALDGAWLVVSPALSGVGGLTPGRYLYPAVTAVAALLAVGLGELPRAARFALGAVTLPMVMVAAALFLAGYQGRSVIPRAVPAAGEGSRVAASAGFDGFTLVADRVLVEQGGRVVLVHLTAANPNSTAVEWSPLPVADTTGGRLVSDYAGSSPFPERMGPGEAYSGWLRMKRPASGIVPWLGLHFSQVATRDYAAVGSIDLEIASVIGM